MPHLRKAWDVVGNAIGRLAKKMPLMKIELKILPFITFFWFNFLCFAMFTYK